MRPMDVGPQRRRQADRTRSQILAAAARHFAERGFAAARLEDVAREVGIGRSAVLYHFKDKRGLYRAVLDHIFGELHEILRSSLMTAGSLADRLESAVGAFVDFMAQRPTAARLAIRESVHPDPQTREDIQRQTQPFLELIDLTFEEGERSGAFRPQRSDPLHLVSTVVGATLFYVAALPTLVGELPFDPLSDEQLAAHKRDMLDVTRRLLGIRAPRALSGGRRSGGTASRGRDR